MDERNVDKPNVTWLSAREDLTSRVEAIFVKHCKRYRAPSQDECRNVATALMVVRDTEDAKPLRKGVTKEIVGARKSSKDLLRNLKPIRRSLEIQIADAGQWDAGYREALNRLNAAANAVEALLVELQGPRIVSKPHRDPISFIKKKVQQAWAEANDGAPPRGQNPNDPLVKVVVDALSLVSMMHVTAHAVSAVLRGKRRTKDKNSY
jgi:hypothetical protein